MYQSYFYVSMILNVDCTTYKYNCPSLTKLIDWKLTISHERFFEKSIIEYLICDVTGSLTIHGSDFSRCTPKFYARWDRNT